MDKQIEAIELMFKNQYDMKFLLKIALMNPDAVIDALRSPVDNEIRELYKAGKRIPAIKLCREEMGLGLKEAKEYCDEISDYDPETFWKEKYS